MQLRFPSLRYLSVFKYVLFLFLFRVTIRWKSSFLRLGYLRSMYQNFNLLPYLSLPPAHVHTVLINMSGSVLGQVWPPPSWILQHCSGVCRLAYPACSPSLGTTPLSSKELIPHFPSQCNPVLGHRRLVRVLVLSSSLTDHSLPMPVHVWTRT